MQSRVKNVVGLGQRSRHALRQLRVSIPCAREFLRSLLDTEEVDLALRRRRVMSWNQRIYRFARSDDDAQVLYRELGSILSTPSSSTTSVSAIAFAETVTHAGKATSTAAAVPAPSEKSPSPRSAAAPTAAPLASPTGFSPRSSRSAIGAGPMDVAVADASALYAAPGAEDPDHGRCLEQLSG